MSDLPQEEMASDRSLEHLHRLGERVAKLYDGQREQEKRNKERYNRLEATMKALLARIDLASRQEPNSPSPLPRLDQKGKDPGRSKHYNLYATPTGARVQPRPPNPHGATQGSHAPPIQEETPPQPSAPCDLRTPFPKMDLQDLNMFFIEAEWWFRQNNIHDHGQMIAYTSQFLKGSAREW
ncbi:hypothetical protein NDA16_004503 [Ustilago loliicola]|nr:hypothetical protein NDA16_004503 [Ustilago loliicola]